VDPAAFPCNLNSDQRPPQRYAGAIQIYVRIIRGKPLLRARQSVLGALQINLPGAFGSFRKDGNAIRQYFGESLNQRDVLGFFAARIVIAQLTNSQLGDQRRVSRQHAQIAVLAG